MTTPLSGRVPSLPPAGTVDPQGWLRLTACECRVLELLASGLAPKQAAWERGVSVATVRSHIASAKRKTGARTLPQLVWAFAEAGTSAQTAAIGSLIGATAGTELL